MATTESRTGFRLPWSTDRAASREASAEAADELAADTAPEPAADTAASAAASDHHEPGVPAEATREHEEDPVTTLAPGAALRPAPGQAARADGPPGAAAVGNPSVAATTPARRPTKFLADLTRAMQAAAEQARASTLDQFRADGTAVIEQIHARSSTGAGELRRRADDDVASIKEWSKAEIARIREETEQRIATRRQQLEGQLERHAALIEHEIEKIRGRLAAFEAEMGRFFDDLSHEDDPAVFAARAASLPEPPSFGDVDDDALGALLHEPGVGMPHADEAPAAPSPAAAAVEEPLVAVAAEPMDREAAIAAIAAAAEAAASLENGGWEVEPVSDASAQGAVTVAEEPGAPDAEPAVEAVAVGSAEVEPMGEAEPTTETGMPAEAEMASAAEAETRAEDAYAEPAPADIDPRLAMLGLTPDFAAAEEAAAEAAAAEVDQMPEIATDAIEARLSGLVPGDTPAAAAAPTATTQVVVTGLVSVASIASFKRHLGRLAGVAHVGVSSGPDGEFVFAVEHAAEASIKELLPTLPGFGARVVGGGDGVVQVSAQDPQD